MICTSDMHFSVCGPKILTAINAASTPQDALIIANEWADRYKQLYAANARSEWPLSDQEYLEQLLDQVFSSTIGEYLVVEDLIFSMALAKYFPRLAALVASLTGTTAIFFYALLAPSPIHNDFAIAKDLNDQIHQALFKKIDSFLKIDWRDKYTNTVQQVYDGMKMPRPSP